jgi:hypothetical protein
MATYDPQRNRGRRPVHDDEPAAVDELLGIADEPASPRPVSESVEPEPASSVLAPSGVPVTDGARSATGTDAVPADVQPGPVPAPSTTPASRAPAAAPSPARRGRALLALAVAAIAALVAWLVWRLRRSS